MTQPLILDYFGYADVKAWVEPVFAAYGLTGTKKPTIAPGPASDVQLQKLSAQALVFLQVGGGAGLSKEGVFDRPFITVRAIGRQRDYDGSEILANLVDKRLLDFDSSGVMNGNRTLYVTRAGGRPTLLELDAGERYHWTCSYLTETRATH